jgi:hypothetical protein
MGVSYRAYVFIGAEIDRGHFYGEGDAQHTCRTHGVQIKPFCGDCGNRCQSEVDVIWTPAMINAANLYKMSPNDLWEQMGGEDGGLYYNQGKNRVGIWQFGYDSDQKMFGMAVAKKSDDDQHGTVKDTLTPDDLGGYLTQVKGAFSAYQIEEPIKIWAIQDCG